MVFDAMHMDCAHSDDEIASGPQEVTVIRGLESPDPDTYYDVTDRIEGLQDPAWALGSRTECT